MTGRDAARVAIRYEGGIMLKGFRDFIARGNALDLAVGVIIGAAFGAIVDSLVRDLITPLLGLMGGMPHFSELKVGPVTLGNFLNAILSFLLKAAGLYFFIILPFNRFAKGLAPPPPPVTPSETYLKEIRDALVKK
jgi:large conductance mechanosensitive channel